MKNALKSNNDVTSAAEKTSIQGFLPSSRTFYQFSGNTEPKPGDKIGYIRCVTDLFARGLTFKVVLTISSIAVTLPF